MNIGENKLECADGPADDSATLSKPSEKHKIFVEKLLTLYFGICYKITIDFYIARHIRFLFKFGEGQWAADKPPTPEIYITSEENAYGILWKNWINGEELKFPINYVTDNDFILKTENTYYLEETTVCTKKHTFNRCVSKAILDANYKIKRTYANVCKNPCLPFSLPWTPQKGKLTTNTSNSGGDDSKTSADEIQKNTGAATNAENENSKQTSSSKQTNSGSGEDNSDTSVADESQKNTGTTKNAEDENSGRTSSDQRDSGRSHRNKREINSNGTLQGVFS